MLPTLPAEPGRAIPKSHERASFAPWAFGCLVVFLAVGVAVVDDYGVGWDEGAQRDLAAWRWEHMRPDVRQSIENEAAGFALAREFYGYAYELPVFLLERALGLDDPRAIYLMRHLVGHSLFLVAGFFAGLLAWRLFHNRALAVLAMLLFLLQPRLYAASFYNSKDLPFLDVFMIALYLTHRALRRDTVAAFAFCGACMGVLINLRIQGVVLFAAVLALRSFDLVAGMANGGHRRAGHVLATICAFTLATLVTLYTLYPWLWGRPLDYGLALLELARFPIWVSELFQGVDVVSLDLPAQFLPVWIAISTPPPTLLLGVCGAIAVCVCVARRPNRILADVELRFLLLALLILAGSIAGVVVLGATMYDGWRHMFFLHAPLVALAVFGLRCIVRESPPLLSRTALGTAAALVLATGAEVTRTHPHQYAWFNFLVDRKTAEGLASRYEMDHRHNACWEGLRHLATRYPKRHFVLDSRSMPANGNLFRLPVEARERFVGHHGTADANVVIRCGKSLRHPDLAGETTQVVYTRKVHNSTVLEVVALGWTPQPENANAAAAR